MQDLKKTVATQPSVVYMSQYASPPQVVPQSQGALRVSVLSPQSLSRTSLPNVSNTLLTLPAGGVLFGSAPQQDADVEVDVDEEAEQKRLTRKQIINNLIMLLPSIFALLCLLLVTHLGAVPASVGSAGKTLAAAQIVLERVHQNLKADPIVTIESVPGDSCTLPHGDYNKAPERIPVAHYFGTRSGCICEDMSTLPVEKCFTQPTCSFASAQSQEDLYKWVGGLQYCVVRSSAWQQCATKSQAYPKECSVDVCVRSVEQCPLNGVRECTSRLDAQNDYDELAHGSESASIVQTSDTTSCVLSYQEAVKKAQATQNPTTSSSSSSSQTRDDVARTAPPLVALTVSTDSARACLNPQRLPLPAQTSPNGNYYPFDVQTVHGCDEFGELGAPYVSQLDAGGARVTLRDLYAVNGLLPELTRLPQFQHAFSGQADVYLLAESRFGVAKACAAEFDVSALRTASTVTPWAHNVLEALVWIIVLALAVCLALGVVFSLSVCFSQFAAFQETRVRAAKWYINSSFIACGAVFVAAGVYFVALRTVLSGASQKLAGYAQSKCFDVDGINTALGAVAAYNQAALLEWQWRIFGILFIVVIYIGAWIIIKGKKRELE